MVSRLFEKVPRYFEKVSRYYEKGSRYYEMVSRLFEKVLVFTRKFLDITRIFLFYSRSVRVAERLALPTLDHGVADSNPAGGEILPEPKRRFIAQSFSCSPFHRLEMTEFLSIPNYLPLN